MHSHILTLATAILASMLRGSAAAQEGNVRGETYYIHGDTLETDMVPTSFLNSTPKGWKSPEAFAKAYPFLLREDTIFDKDTTDDWHKTYHRYRSANTYMLMGHYGDGLGADYADIRDERIGIRRGIHVGMEVEQLWKLLELPPADRTIHHIVAGAAYDTEYRFDIADNKIIHITIRTSQSEPNPWNPSPMATFVEPVLGQSDRGPKIYARPREQGEMLPTVCYVNAEGDTIVPYERGYYWVGWDEIGRLGLVYGPENRPGWLAIDHEGRELFRVFGLADFSPDWVADGMFRIVDGKQYDGGLIGFADTLGVVRIKPQYRYATAFRFGRAMATMSGHLDRSDPEHPEWVSNDWFYIDPRGNRLGKAPRP